MTKMTKMSKMSLKKITKFNLKKHEKDGSFTSMMFLFFKEWTQCTFIWNKDMKKKKTIRTNTDIPKQCSPKKIRLLKVQFYKNKKGSIKS